MQTSLTNALAWAAQAPADAPAPPGLMEQRSPLIPMFAIIFLLYVFLIQRPQRKEQQARQNQLSEMKKGDAVITAGGIHGKVESVNKEDETVTIMVSPKVPMKFNLSSVVTVKPKGGAKGEENEAGEGART